MRDEVHFGRVVRCFVERPPHIDAMLRAAASRTPAAWAISDYGRRTNYGELDAAVERIAANLAALGIAQGDRVGLVVGNCTEFIESLLALARLGAISVPIGTRQQQPENEFALTQSGAKAVIYETEFADRIPTPESVPNLRHRIVIGDAPAGTISFNDLRKAAPPAPKPQIAEDDVFAIVYTSGTTGRPKGAMLTHLGTIHSCLHYRDCLGLGVENSLLAAPASHVTGLIANILTTTLCGGCNVIMRNFKARDLLRILSEERVTFTLLVPAMYNLALLDPEFERFDLKSWRVGGYGGSPMPEPTIHRVAEKLPGLQLFNLYGATETHSPTTATPPEDASGRTNPDTVGKTVPCGEVRIMDDAGHEVAPGEPGELWIAGPMVVPGYWQNPEANKENFVGGYWKSGDIGSKDADGYVRVFDRKKDMINRGGFKIYSAEVENLLTQHPSIVECAVVGRPDPVLGEKTHVFVVPRPGDGLSESDLRAYCSARLADYKVPDGVTLVADALPRNANGKVIKTALKAQLLERAVDRR